MISRIRYTFREMWASLTRNLTLTVAAVITSMVSLFLFGMTLLIQQAFDNQLSQWTGGVKMIVYVKNGAAARCDHQSARGAGEPAGDHSPGRVLLGRNARSPKRRSCSPPIPSR